MQPLHIAFVLLFGGLACLVGSKLLPQRARIQLTQRIGLVQVQPTAPAARLARADRIGETLRRWLTLGSRYRWGMRLSPLLLVALLLGSGAAAVLLGQALGVTPWLTLPGAAALSMVLPRAILRRQQSRAEAAFMNHFPDAIDMAIRMLRAGLPVTAIVRVIGREAPSPINQVFTRLADQLEIGLSFTEALNAMSERIGLADFRFFVMAVSLQSDTGGNLATTLETLSAIIRKRREIRLQARSSTAEVRVSALLLGGLPLLVTVLLLVTNPRYLLPLFADRRGNLIVLVALAMWGSA